jgi:hypothetical protein
MVIEEKALEEIPISELAKHFAEEWKNWRNTIVHSHPDLDHTTFKEIVKSIKAWQKRDPSAEELCTFILILLTASFVESDIETKFEKAFADKFSSVLK